VSDAIPVSWEDFDRACFSVDDVKEAARRQLNGKVPGPDGIPNEVFKEVFSLSSSKRCTTAA